MKTAAVTAGVAAGVALAAPLVAASPQQRKRRVKKIVASCLRARDKLVELAEETKEQIGDLVAEVRAERPSTAVGAVSRTAGARESHVSSAPRGGGNGHKHRTRKKT